jgi:hypothetical protein
VIRFLLPAIFGVWLILSIAVYLPGARRFVRCADWLMLIPTWKFFAPLPGQSDFNVLYQDKYADGTLTQWTEITAGARRRWWAAVWNPDKRANKALFDIVQELAAVLQGRTHVPEFTLSYLSLLNHVARIPRSTSPPFTRFMLMTSQGNAEPPDPELLFMSRFHEL